MVNLINYTRERDKKTFSIGDKLYTKDGLIHTGVISRILKEVTTGAVIFERNILDNTFFDNAEEVD